MKLRIWNVMIERINKMSDIYMWYFFTVECSFKVVINQKSYYSYKINILK